MSFKRYISLVICLLSILTANAQTPGKSCLAVNSDGDSLVQVRFSWGSGPGLMLVGWNFSVLLDDTDNTPLHFNTGSVGAPDLPTASTLVHLPVGSTLTVNGIDIGEFHWEEMVPNDFPLAPVTRAWAKDQEWPGYEPDEKIYSTDAFYRGGEPIEIENLGLMGGEQVFRVTVRPVAYNPVSGDLLVDTLLTATLSAKSSTTYDPLPSNRYLIVSRPLFQEGLQPFVQWKRQEGYDVVELYSDTHLRDSVKEMIRPFFVDATPLSPAPEYVLLVGDAAQLQAFNGKTNLDGETHITDLYYIEFTGDYLPDAMLGRWPVNDTAELRVVVEKTLRYEQLRDLDTLQLKRMLLVAGEEDYSPAPITTNGQVNYVAREAKTVHPEIDTLCYHNPASGSQLNNIIADLGEGVGLLSYTAHCTVGGWSSPSMSIGSVESANASQPTVFVNNCCKSNSFTGTCFGEQLLRLPLGGGVGVIGATNSTLWNEDYYWAVGPKAPVTLNPVFDSMYPGAFDGLVGRLSTVTTMGELLRAGNLAVTAFGSAYSRFYWEVYCLFGDPSLQPWIGVPQPIDLQVTNGLSNGDNLVHVSGTQGARVTVMQDAMLLGVADIDNTGHAVIELRQTLDTLPLVLTATGVNLWPRVDTFSVNAVESGVTLRNVVVDDSVVRCTVENIGNVRYDSLRVELSQVRTQPINGAVIESQIVIVDSLLPHGQTEVSLPVNVLAIGQEPLWDAMLYLWDDDNGIMSWLPIMYSLPVTYPDLSLHLLNNDGTEVRQLLAGNDYFLETHVEGSFDSLILTVASQPTDILVSLSTQFSTLNTPFHTPDSLCSLHIDATLFFDRWSQRYEYWLESGSRTDGFENSFLAHGWDNSGRVPWTIDGAVCHGGRYSARSGAIGDGQSSSLCIEMMLDRPDSVAFWIKTSTEPQYDKFTFYIDGIRKLPEAWGETDWNRRTYTLDAGHHTLCWTYAKDQSGSAGSDCVWLDDVRLPLVLWDSLYNWDCSGPSVGTDHTPLLSRRSPLNIYPNPAIGEVWMETGEPMAVVVHDALGRTVASFNLPADSPVRWNVERLPSGLFFVTGTNDRHTVCSKIIIRKN